MGKAVHSVFIFSVSEGKEVLHGIVTAWPCTFLTWSCRRCFCGQTYCFLLQNYKNQDVLKQSCCVLCRITSVCNIIVLSPTEMRLLMSASGQRWFSRSGARSRLIRRKQQELVDFSSPLQSYSSFKSHVRPPISINELHLSGSGGHRLKGLCTHNFFNLWDHDGTSCTITEELFIFPIFQFITTVHFMLHPLCHPAQNAQQLYYAFVHVFLSTHLNLKNYCMVSVWSLDVAES